MGRDAHLKSRTERGGPDLSFGSLSKTLEDLEARLSRLSNRKPEADAGMAAPDAAAPAADRLRALAAARRSAREDLGTHASPLALERRLRREIEAVRPEVRASRAAPAAPAGDPLEEVREQGSTVAMMRDIAAEVSQLRFDIQDGLDAGMEPRFAELRTSFADLKRMIGERAGADRIGAEIFEIMEALTELTAGTADQASIDALKAELDAVGAMVGQLAREETLDAVQRRWDAFEQRIADRVELDGQAQRDLRTELERLRASLRSLATEEQILAVQQRWDEFEARYLEDVRRETEETLTRFLRDELDGMRGKLDQLAEQTSASALDARFADLAGRIGIDALEAGVERLSGRVADIENALVSLPEILRIDELEARIQLLAEGIDALAGESRRADEAQFAEIETRLDEMSAAIIAAAHPVLDLTPVARIEQRVETLAARIESFADGGESIVLSAQIAALSDRIEEMGNASGFRELGSRIDGLSERVEALFRTAGAPVASSALEERLTLLAQRLEEAAGANGKDGDAIGALEAQIRRLAEHVGGGETGFEAVVERLGAVERQLDESRDNVILAARAAAEEAVRRMQSEDRDRESGYVRELAQDLRNLEALHRESDERTFGVFDAVHATLLKIVERLTVIEREIRREEGAAPIASRAEDGDIERIEWAAARIGAGTAREDAPSGLRATLSRHLARRSARGEANAAKPDAPAVPAVAATPATATDKPFVGDAPSLDAAETVLARELNRPLAPGSGAPDIAALIERVRQQQRGEIAAPSQVLADEPPAKADFIAAARKAAMAAAAEAEALRDHPGEAGGRDPDGKPGSRSRKPILMAVGAVLLALAGMAGGRAYLAAGDETLLAAGEPAAIEAPFAARTSDLAAANAPAAVPAAAAPAPQAPPASVVAAAPEPAPAPAVAEAAPASGEAPATTASIAPAPAEAGALELATSRLPAGARGALPALPDTMGPAALVEAVQAGDAMALFEVGLRIMEGRTAPSDPAAALPWFAQSAARGFAPAQYSLGTLFEKGNGTERDTGAARDWYSLAAAQGNIRAMHNLAVLYATGVEGVSDPARAADWFLQAARHGMRDSQYNLGILYARGAGVEQDLSSSYRWFGIVGKGGDRDAQSKMAEVGKTLPPEDRARIDAEVAAWTPEPRAEAANTVDIPAAWAPGPTAQNTAAVDMPRAIRNVQAILVKLGYDAGRPDGVVGAQTEAAIRSFQENAGLQATGRIDETLIRALLERKDA